MVNRLYLIIICFLFLLYSSFVNGYLIITSLGLAFSIFIFLDFVNKIGNELPIKEFILSLASFQWIVGAKISYNLGKQHYKYYMYVEESDYMGYVVPAVLLFYIGISFFPNRLKLNTLQSVMNANKSRVLNGAKALIIIGVLSIVISRFYQGGFSFIFFLSELLLYVGIGYMAYIYPKSKYIVFGLTIGIIFVASVNQGSFHKLLLVGIFMAFFVLNQGVSFIKKLVLLVIGVSIIYVIQSVKHDLREVVWRSNSAQSPISVFWDLLKSEFVMDEEDFVYVAEQDESLKEQADLNVRLNQGWIISKTLENVPKRIPFQNGRSVLEAIEASFLPRFLFPNKVGAAEGLNNFRRVTGLQLNSSTSMELSVVAELYANYGHIGGQLAMLFYGILIALIVKLINNTLGGGSVLVYLWFILFFFQPVKAEIDLIKIINHFVKSIIFFVMVNYFIVNILGCKLFEARNGEKS